MVYGLWFMGYGFFLSTINHQPLQWSPQPGLNRWPLPYQGSALPLSYVGKKSVYGLWGMVYGLFLSIINHQLSILVGEEGFEPP